MEIGGVSVRLPHVCKECGVALSEDGSNFPTRWVSGRQYYRFLCRKCFNQYCDDRKPSLPGFTACRERNNQVHKERMKKSRIDNPALWISIDCKKWDKRNGFASDSFLTEEFAKQKLSDGCLYCGATYNEVHIGLDRIDNQYGHSVGNVNPSCTRCNLVRGDMPYAAWLLVAQGMRLARDQGLFGDWIPGNCKK